MERQIINKRKRVFFVQPNKNPKVVFARKYARQLVPALKKINMNKPSSQIKHTSFEEQTVKQEVDIALALSAQEFAWSHFLQHKQLYSPDEYPSYTTKIVESASHKQDGEEEEEAEIKKRLKELQKLLPGGEENNMEEMLSEIGNYIVCLEMQMIVLNSLVQDNTF